MVVELIPISRGASVSRIDFRRWNRLLERSRAFMSHPGRTFVEYEGGL
jgi:hypothetical protein